MITDKYRDYMLNLIKKVIAEIGPREPASENERKTARLFANEWEPICDKVEIESFTCSPTAFLGFFPILIGLYVLAIPFYWIFPPVSFALALVGFLILLLQFVRYVELLDRFYPKRQAENVTGTIRPRGEVKRRIILCGHIDSAYEFNLWLFLKNAAIPHMIFAVVIVLFLVGCTLAKSIAYFSGSADASVYKWLGIACIALYPIIAPFLFFHTYSPVLGAMDDLAGVSIAAGVGKYLSDSKKDGSFFLENTEILLVGMACEEAGLRGARAYVKKHKDAFKSIPTHAIIFDGVCDERHLTVITSEICTGAKHDPKLVKLALDSAAANGWNMKKTLVPLGASDATEFSKAGISSTCLLCQDTSKLSFNYHTRFDTVENIRPQSLSMLLQVALDMVKSIDKNGV